MRVLACKICTKISDIQRSSSRREHSGFARHNPSKQSYKAVGPFFAKRQTCVRTLDQTHKADHDPVRMKMVFLLPIIVLLAAAQLPRGTDSRPVILAFGDSLTAGFGVPAGFGYPEQLQKKLDSNGYNYRVVNMGISGDTTSGGRSRMKDRKSVV